MKNSTRLTIFLCFLLVVPAATWADSTTSENVPPAIAIPANQALRLTLKAQGDQVYECRAVSAAPDKFGWVLKEPDADLFDEQGHKVGHHSAGPKWELSSGDTVTGHLHSKAQSPDAKGIPWLLIDAEKASGPTLGKVISIQRVDTVGGQAPDEPTDSTMLGQIKRIKYTATYKFYAEK
ncbi:MAG: DUF3455 domain-containing protein [Candidatus Obscuribacterales bacterium]|nr:DUF3455 domain-containing protein [Candidatus Obscuribacterales bacterium]